MDKAASAGHSDRCRIVVDTCCDFSPEVAANLDVDILGFPFIIDGEERTDDIWSSITPKEFYDRMRAGARVSTSAVSLGRYIEFFTECAKEGTPTVYLCFTSALSSSYNSACQAADAVRAEYPDFELYVVDNALPCATGALLALEAVRQRSAGLKDLRPRLLYARELRRTGCRRPHSARGGAAYGKARCQARALLRPCRLAVANRCQPRPQEGTQVHPQVVPRELRARSHHAHRHYDCRCRKGR